MLVAHPGNTDNQMGFFFAFFAQAMAPLHWYSQRSGRFDTVTRTFALSYPQASKACFRTSFICSEIVFMSCSFYRNRGCRSQESS